MEKEADAREPLHRPGSQNSGGIVIVQVEIPPSASSPQAVKLQGPGGLRGGHKPENHMQTFGKPTTLPTPGRSKVSSRTIAPIPERTQTIARRAAMFLKINARGEPRHRVEGRRLGRQRRTYSTSSRSPSGLAAWWHPRQTPRSGRWQRAGVARPTLPVRLLRRRRGSTGDGRVDGEASTSAGSGTRIAGAGGFINISQNARTVYFLHLRLATRMTIENSSLRILGRALNKFVGNVGQVTFSGEYAGGEARPSTGRCVFRLTGRGSNSGDRAGLVLDRDILSQMAFRPIIDNIRSMDARIFAAEKMGLKERSPMSLDERLSRRGEQRRTLTSGDGYPGRRIKKLADYLDRWFSRLGRKVHVVVNYDNFYLGPPARGASRWSKQRGRILSLLDPLFDGRFLQAPAQEDFTDADLGQRIYGDFGGPVGLRCL